MRRFAPTFAPVPCLARRGPPPTRLRRLLPGLLVAALIAAAGTRAAQAEIDPDLLAGMKARSIGPAGMSGRVAAVDSVVANPDIVYVGASTGGVWKSNNGGLTWKPVFDDQPVAAIGAVAVFQPAPDIVWVGTGEGNPRNSASVGNGVYKSLDGGETWTHLGLEKSERIHRIVLHPTDPNIAWVASLGPEWGEGEQRGVFKTTDGGRTWKRVLFVDAKTGCGDLVSDPGNPSKLIAAMWEFRRWPYFFRSGGPGSGLYVSLDGGETWTKRTPEDGLPEGNLGRIGLAIAPSDPSIVYALVEAEKSALIASRDGGRTWKKINDDPAIIPRPFYFADLRVDAEYPDRVYSLGMLVQVSEDGGKTFRVLVPFRDVHPDYHAMWINPRDSRQIIVGNDGGVAISLDRGETWRFAANLPLAQFYHVRLDNETPYHVYGGMQDNGSWRGPSAVWENGGIRNAHWEEVDFGDGFDTAPLATDPSVGYAMSQEGYLVRWDLRTGERKDIRPAGPKGVKLRFNWNAGIALDPFAPDTVYYGSQFVHRSTDRGETWQIISPDLTTNSSEWQKQGESGGLTPDVTGAENFTTIIAIAPSPSRRGVLWIGTDDGRLHITQDGGVTWSSLEKNLPGVPPNTWIPHIAPSPHDAATAFVVLDDHRRSNWTPYVLRTTDFGHTWKSLATREISGYCLSIVQDPVDPELLFLGTEFGLYVSLDGGRRWMKWTHGFPTVSAMDLAIHPREHDLVIGTHGRAAYVLDDIRPLRSFSEAVLAEPVHLFEVPDAQQYWVKQAAGLRFTGHGEFRGENEPYGALITYSLNVEGLPHPREAKERERKEKERQAARREKESKGPGPAATPEEAAEKKAPEAEITIRDGSGRLVRAFKVPAKLGVNRAVWDLRRDKFREPPRQEPEPEDESGGGSEVLPGVYEVRVAYQKHEARGAVRVISDPRFDIARSEREAKWETVMRAGALQETATEAIERLLDTRADVELIVKRAKAAGERQLETERRDAGPLAISSPEENPNKDLIDAGGKLMDGLRTLERRLRVPPKTQGIPEEKDAMSKISYARGALESSWGAPTPAQLAALEAAERLLSDVLVDVNRLFDVEVGSFRRRAEAKALELLPSREPLRAGTGRATTGSATSR